MDDGERAAENAGRSFQGQHLSLHPATFERLKLVDATTDTIETLRLRIGDLAALRSVEEPAQAMVEALVQTFPEIVLARTFLAVPFAKLPEKDREFARGVAGSAAIADGTRVLSLIGTYGQEEAWRSRDTSKGHLAIPLVSREFVSGIPMIAKLLSDLEIDLSSLADDKQLGTRRMLGGKNGAFHVPLAASTRDLAQRLVIPSQDFVSKHDVKTVFGMGGAYMDGTLVVTILFTNVELTRLAVDRFSVLVSYFKMATAEQLRTGRVFKA